MLLYKRSKTIEKRRKAMKTNYYIFIMENGKKIPVKSQIRINSLAIATCFYEAVISFYPIDFMNYVIAGGEF